MIFEPEDPPLCILELLNPFSEFLTPNETEVVKIIFRGYQKLKNFLRSVKICEKFFFQRSFDKKILFFFRDPQKSGRIPLMEN